jgi:nicotinate-nucleotide adenylyltransferase
VKLGVFGGTFDPIHIGHLVIAEEAREQLCLDEVVFIPAGKPWFKAEVRITDASHRFAMVELAVASNPAFLTSDLEMVRSGPSYTVDTLELLHEKLGESVELFVVLGADALADLVRWHRPKRILELATVVGVTRPSYRLVDLQQMAADLDSEENTLRLLDGPLVEISGTEIRRRIQEKRSIRYLVPEPVATYIQEHMLYR